MTRTSLVGPGRHRDDRAILALAIPAFGALAADPLYSLTDTAMVGNLGTRELGALAVGATAFTASFWIFSFLAYGVTARVARALGAGDTETADRTGVAALLLAVLLGTMVSILGVLFAGPIVRLLGAGPGVAPIAETYLQIRVLAAAPVLIAQVGHGWLRGAQDTRTPTYIAVAGLLVHIPLAYILIYPAGGGVAGAAWATVIGESGAAIAFVIVLARRMHHPQWRFDFATARSLLRIGSHLAIRTGSLLAGMTFATGMAARMGEIALGSWQVAMQMFLLLALTLDCVAIAAQALIGRRLGAGKSRAAMEVSDRLMWWGIVLGIALGALLLPLAQPIASLFTDDRSLTEATATLLVWVALAQPLAAVAFTLDGVLIGASDTRFLAWSMAASSALYVAIAYVSLRYDLGTAGLVIGATVWLMARVASTGVRWRRGRWMLA